MNNEQNNEFNKDSDFFLLKMIRGDYGLFQTYWFFSFIPSLIFSLFLTIFKNKISDDIRLFLILIFSLYGAITLIGIWKSANNYLGNKVWLFLSKLSVILGSISIIASLITLLGIYNYETISSVKSNLTNLPNEDSSIQLPNEIQDNEKIDFEVVKFVLLTDRHHIHYIKDYTGGYYLIIQEAKPNYEISLFLDNNFYYDEKNKTIHLSTKIYHYLDIINNKITSKYKDEFLSASIYLKDGSVYTSKQLKFSELSLITFAPEYIDQINFYSKSAKLK